MGDCEAHRCAFGPITFIAHDFGEWFKIPIGLARKLQVETEVEWGQFASFYVASGIWYDANKRKRVPPSRAVIKQLAGKISLT